MIEGTIKEYPFRRIDAETLKSFWMQEWYLDNLKKGIDLWVYGRNEGYRYSEP